MVTLTHPVGNQNVRQALAALYEHGLLKRFCTTVYWDKAWMVNRCLPDSLRAELNRRSYPQIPSHLVHSTPTREAMRLLAIKLRLRSLATREDAPLSITRVCRSLDTAAASLITRHPSRAVYAYSGSALKTFRAARSQGMACICELPAGHWNFDAALLREEAELQPEYAATMDILDRDPELFRSGDEELDIADAIIVPSHFIQRTLEYRSLPTGKLFVVPYGAHEHRSFPSREPRRGGKLRALFVGALIQRKGISYALDAVKMIPSLAELTLLGRKVGTCRAIDAAVRENRWIESIPHTAVLEEMSRHDVLVLPSLSEGFGLVILEALSCGLPVITTHNTGGPEIIRDGREGFFVPIRSAQAIAEKLELLARDHDLLKSMSEAAIRRAQECTWSEYRTQLVSTVTSVLHQEGEPHRA